jgi:hypothetical protein
MVWHIFKKDWKLSWPFVLLAALLHWISAYVYYSRGLFSDDVTLEMLSEYLPALALFASMFLIASIVHLEAIPGVRQDWLVRPVPHGVLLLEKLLFVLVAVEGPIFAANLAEGLADGFSLPSSLFHALGYTAVLLFFLVLPIFTFSSVTRNMTEAFILGCGCTFIIGAFLTLTGWWDFASHHTLLTVTHSGIGWIGEFIRFGLVTVAACAILGLGYFRRKTSLARILVLAFGLVLLVSSYLPWKPVFAIETRLSPRPGAAAAVNLAFEPTLERYKPPSGLKASNDPGSGNGNENNARAFLFLPIRITGMGYDTILLADRVDVFLIDDNGRTVYHGAGGDLEVAREGPQPHEEPRYQQFPIPRSIYDKVHDQNLTVRLDYSLTLFGLDKSFSLPALNGETRTPDWGWCRSKMNEAGTAVMLHCMKPGTPPTCATAFLENATSGVRNPSRSACLSEYGPFQNGFSDDISRFGVSFPFRDPAGLAKYPVDGSQLPESRAVIRMYQPEDHFTRTLVIPNTKLLDWESQ